MPFGAPDLRAFCSTGVPVVFQGVSKYSDGVVIRGLLDTPMQIKLMEQGIGGTQAEMPELRLPFNAFSPMPRSRDIVTVLDESTGTTTDYEVSAPTAEDDGAFLCYQLTEPE